MYDMVFVTHLPAFYKVNLYNEIAKYKKIYVLFIGTGSTIRTKDFCDFNMNFDHSFLFNDSFEKVNIFNSLMKVINFLKKVNYDKIVLGGWDKPVLWMFAFLSSKKKNYTVIESSIYESKVHGLYLIIKKLYKSRMSGVFVSGEPQKLLAKKIGYNNIIITGGVGLFNKISYEKQEKDFNKRFLFIGRLSEEKNLFFLIDIFKSLSDATLEIIGNGPLKEDIVKHIDGSCNIKYYPHIENNLIYKKYLENDIFILPSIKEPWGLVVEEALYYGLPVIVSNKVGSKDDMVLKYNSGKIVDINCKNEFTQAIKYFYNEENYKNIKLNVERIDFDQLFINQIESYNI